MQFVLLAAVDTVDLDPVVRLGAAADPLLVHRALRRPPPGGHALGLLQALRVPAPSRRVSCVMLRLVVCGGVHGHTLVDATLNFSSRWPLVQ